MTSHSIACLTGLAQAFCHMHVENLLKRPVYACEIWGQNQTNFYFKKLLHLQELFMTNEALRINDFKPQTSA